MNKAMAYRDLDHALKHLRLQVIEGIPYAQTHTPALKSTTQVFNWLKARTKYKNDPKGTELFQTLPTLLENNWHGVTGAGDCDCFTIATLTLLLANGFKNCGIVLVGRNPLNAVHIYSYVIDRDGKKKYLDLTNRRYNYERPGYNFYQEIPFKLTPKEIADMRLQLADGGKPGPYSAYNPYIFLPSKGIQVREDYFDNMPMPHFAAMLAEEGYNQAQIVELAGRGKARRAERRANRTQKKKDRAASKKERRDSRSQKRRDKGEAKKMRAQAKIEKAQRGGGFDWDKVKEVGGSLISKFRGGGDDGGEAAPQYAATPVYAPQPAYQPPMNIDQYQPDYDPYGGGQQKMNQNVMPPPPPPDDEPKDGFFEGSFDIFGMQVPKIAAYGVGIAVGYVALKKMKVIK